MAGGRKRPPHHAFAPASASSGSPKAMAVSAERALEIGVRSYTADQRAKLKQRTPVPPVATKPRDLGPRRSSAAVAQRVRARHSTARGHRRLRSSCHARAVCSPDCAERDRVSDANLGRWLGMILVMAALPSVRRCLLVGHHPRQEQDQGAHAVILAGCLGNA